MDEPRRLQRRGGPPKAAIILTTVADERDDAELLLDGMLDIYRGFQRLQALQTRRGLRRVRWIPATSPVIAPELDRAA